MSVVVDGGTQAEKENEKVLQAAVADTKFAVVVGGESLESDSDDGGDRRTKEEEEGNHLDLLSD